MSPEMPAAVIENATSPNQRTVRASLENISRECEDNNIQPPAVLVIGRGANADTELDWLSKKPLFGRSIVLTRDEKGNADFATKVISEGGNPIKFPVIKVQPLTESNRFLQVLSEIKKYEWVIFTSANGVLLFFDVLHRLKQDARVFGSAKIAAIGCGTKAKLSEFGIKADFMPTVYTSVELGRQLNASAELRDKRVLLLRSELASGELSEMLTQAGAEVEDAAIYTVLTEKLDAKWLIEDIGGEKIDWITFCSPSSAEAFFEQVESSVVNLSRVKVAAIGPVTSKKFKELNIDFDVKSIEHTISGLLEAIKGSYE
jgi:uroporphyrinogen III methyltransferase/synthase